MRDRIREIIFGTGTRTGRVFDIALIASILASLVVVSLESVKVVHDAYGPLLLALEWVFTVLFSLEYVLRLWCARDSLRYARSFFGVVDLLSILPTWLGLILTGSHSLVVIRALRILRIFRVLKLAQFLREAGLLVRALRASRFKIIVFLGAVLCIVVIMAAVMHMIEGPENGFTSIPYAMYWAIVTMTTVGYGDVAPHTSLGQAVASLLMILGYGIIAVPTGIVSAELVQAGRDDVREKNCARCGLASHQHDARHCRRCGEPLPPG